MSKYDHWSKQKEECYQDFKARFIEELMVKEKPKKRKAKKPEYWKEEVFIIHWDAYPKKVGKEQAFKAWQALKPERELSQKIYAHFTEAYKHTEKTFIPNFATYLNQARWNDEIIEKEPELLKLPADNEELWGFAKEHGLPDPDRAQDFFQYRAKLNKHIAENFIMRG